MATTEWSWPARPWASGTSEHPRSTWSFDREAGAIRSRAWKLCGPIRDVGGQRVGERAAGKARALHPCGPPGVFLRSLWARASKLGTSAREPVGHLDRKFVRSHHQLARFFAQLGWNGDRWQFTRRPRTRGGFVGPVEHPAMMIQAGLEQIERLSPEGVVVAVHAVTDPRGPAVDTAAMVRLWVSTSASRHASKSGDTTAMHSCTPSVDLCRLAAINLVSRC